MIIFFLPVGISAKVLLGVTEVLKNPKGPESSIPGGESHELIELANIGSDSLFLGDLFLSDGSAVDSILPWTQPISWHPKCCFNLRVIPPGRIAIILDRDYIKASLDAAFKIADSTIILTVDAASLVGGLTEKKGFFVYKGTRKAIRDSLAGFMDEGQRISLSQKIFQTSQANAPDGFSLIPDDLLFLGTKYRLNPDTISPGIVSSVNKQWIVEYKFSNRDGYSAQLICSLAVLKMGISCKSGVLWLLKKGQPQVSIMQGMLPDTQFPVFISIPLLPDSEPLRFDLHDNSTVISTGIDFSSLSLPSGSIRINEISPRSTPEWIELVNVSSLPILLSSWRINTNGGFDTLTKNIVRLLPGQYMIVTGNLQQFLSQYPFGVNAIQSANWRSIDNYSDTISLFAPGSKTPHEKVCFKSIWFQSWERQSIERIGLLSSGCEQATWSLSEKPSPGLPNPGIAWKSSSAPTMEIGPVPFTPDGDGEDDSLSINIKLPPTWKMEVGIWGMDGLQLYTFPSVSHPCLMWTGRKTDGSFAPVGPFMVVGVATNGSRKIILRKKGVLWR